MQVPLDAPPFGVAGVDDSAREARTSASWVRSSACRRAFSSARLAAAPTASDRARGRRGASGHGLSAARRSPSCSSTVTARPGASVELDLRPSGVDVAFVVGQPEGELERSGRPGPARSRRALAGRRREIPSSTTRSATARAVPVAPAADRRGTPAGIAAKGRRPPIQSQRCSLPCLHAGPRIHDLRTANRTPRPLRLSARGATGAKARRGRCGAPTFRRVERAEPRPSAATPSRTRSCRCHPGDPRSRCRPEPGAGCAGTAGSRGRGDHDTAWIRPESSTMAAYVKGRRQHRRSNRVESRPVGNARNQVQRRPGIPEPVRELGDR